MRLYFGLIQILVLLVCGLGRADYNVLINHINDVTHFELPAVYTSDYNLVQKADHIELTVSQLQASSIDQLRQYNDQFIKKITVEKSSSLNKDIVKIYPKNSNIQMFEYLTDSPVALSVDFYIDDQKIVKDSTKDNLDEEEKIKLTVKKKNRSPSSDGTIQVSDSKSAKNYTQEMPAKLDYSVQPDKPIEIDQTVREIARKVTDETFDLINFDSNKIIFNPDSIIESRGKLFLKFPILQSENKDIDQIIRKKVAYEIESSDDKETINAIELRKTFVDGQYRDFIKNLNKFSKKYPKSRYDQMLKYMQADSVLELSRVDNSRPLQLEALNIYDSIVKKFPDSPLAERTLLFTSLTRTQVGDHIGAIRNLKYYLSKYETSPLRSNIHLLLAQNMLRASEFKESIDIYNKLINGNDQEIKIEATYNIGDAYFERKEYKKAIYYYGQAWSKFPKEKNRFPNAYFNKAEAEFLEEEYKVSLESFRDFLKNFPQHSYSHYAMTRLGEIFEIVGEDPLKWRGFYNESIFRFKSTTGGALAKVRLLWHQIVSTENKRVQILVDDMMGYQSQIKLPQADEFMIFQLSDAYFYRGLYKQATNTLMSYFKKVEKPLYAEKFQKRIGRGISYQIRDHINKGELKDAFQTFEDYDDVWFKKSERIDFSYFKGLAYEKAKVFPAAIQSYNEFFAKFNKLSDPEIVRVYEELPAVDSMRLRLAFCYLENHQYDKAAIEIAAVKEKNINAAEKSEALIILAKIDMSNERWSAALEILKKIEKTTYETALLKIEALSHLQKSNLALEEIDNYLDTQKPNDEEKFNFLKRKISLLEDSKNNQSEIFSFMQRFHDEFKNTQFSYDEIKYKLGMQLSYQQKHKEAEEVWSTISDGTAWKNLAAEAVKGKRWNDQYKKYIDRIPAMADKKGSEK